MRKPKTSRGTILPARADHRVDARNAAAMAVLTTAPSQIATSVSRSRVEYWQDMSAILAEGANYAAKIATRQLKEMFETGVTKPCAGLKDITTIAAIMVDKGVVIDQALAAHDPNRNSSSLDELEKRIALLFAANAEMQRRIAEAKPLDVTPPAPPKG